MDAIIRDFALSLQAEGKKPKTIRTYTDAAAWLQRSQGIEDWHDVTKAQIRKHIADIVDTKSKAYANNQYRALQQFMKFLEAEEDIKNPMATMKPPTVPEKLVPVISEAEWQKLIATCSGKTFYDLRDKALLEMFRASGARLSEITNLRVIDVDLDQLAAIVTGKASRMRIVRFDAKTGLAINRYMRARAKYRHAGLEALWTGQDGALTPNGVYQMVKRRAERAGIEMNPHRFRHDFSHRWLLNDGQEGDLMAQNGWSSSQMLRRYGASASAERARKHYDKVMR